jgi:hypothetical protein
MVCGSEALLLIRAHLDRLGRGLCSPFDQTRHFIWLGKVDRVAAGNLDGFAAGPLGHAALEIGIDVADAV